MAVKHRHRPVRTLVEARRPAKIKSSSKGPQNLSLAWDESDYLSVPGVERRNGLLTDRDRKDILYKAYCSNTWIGACVDVISKRMTSGGWEVEPVEQGKGDEKNRDRLKQLLLYVNDDEDFLQFTRSIMTDLLIFGEAYCEIVPGSDGLPAQLHKIDCLTMSYRLDPHGQILGYTQMLDKSTATIDLSPEQVIRWWLPDPRSSKKALSPIEGVKDAVYLYNAMLAWSVKFFKQGAKPSFSVEMGLDSNIDDAQRFIKFFKENYTGSNNAHVPPVMYNGSKIVEFGHGSIDVDFMQGLTMMRTEILAAYGVPPALVGVIESGNIGGGSGEDQEKSFQYNTVDPYKQIYLEKFNFRIPKKAFGITDYLVSVRSADYRNDLDIVKVQDTQIRNGSQTINEARLERGRSPVEGGDEAVFAVSREVLPVSRLADLGEEQTQSAKLDLDMKQAQTDKLKQPPPEPTQQSPSMNGAGPKVNNPQLQSPQGPQESTSFFVRAVQRDGNGEHLTNSRLILSSSLLD
jgi:HK97 family phage portal protein